MHPRPSSRRHRLTLLAASGAIAVAGLAAVAAPATAAAPSNDSLASATVLTADVPTEGTTVDATLETGETASCGNTTVSSVWYRYTPATDQTFLAQTFRVGDNTDTTVEVFTGTAFPLTSVGCNDDAGGGYFSSLEVAATAGTTYYIRVADFSATSIRGAFGVRVKVGDPAPTRPANDDLGSAAPAVVGLRSSVDTRLATAQAGEPVPSCGAVAGSQWFRYTAAVDRDIDAATVGAQDAVLALWSGPAQATDPSTLTEVDCGGGGGGGDAFAGVDGVAGTTYYVQVGTASPATGTERTFELELDQSFDDFTRTVLAGSSAAQTVSLSATVSRDPYGNDTTDPVTIPADRSGTVSFYEGTSVVATAPVSGGVASVTVAGVSPGAHTYRAVYTSSLDFYRDSFSRSVSVTVAATTQPAPPAAPTAPTASAASATSVKAPGKVRKGKKAKASVTVLRGGAAATGTVSATARGKSLGSATLVGGKAVFAIGKIKKKTTVVVTYTGNATTAASAGKATIKIKKKGKKGKK